MQLDRRYGLGTVDLHVSARKGHDQVSSISREDRGREGWREWFTPPTARELHAVRRSMVEHLQNSFEQQAMAQMLELGKATLIPHAPTPQASARLLLDDEYQRLTKAQLYYVNDEMTDIAHVAGDKLPNFRLSPEDIPAEQGFVFWENPIGSYYANEWVGAERIYIFAASWGPSTLTTDGGVWVTFWSATNYANLVDHLCAAERSMSRSEALRAARSLRAELTWDNETYMYWTESDIPLSEITLGNTGSTQADDELTLTPWVQRLRATWLLMMQRGYTSTDSLPMNRQSRRRAERDGFDSRPVEIIRLRGSAPRGTAASEGDAGTGRKLSVRQAVVGHWKHIAYGPNRSKRRLDWVDGYMRGPEGAPLASRDKVYLVDRANTTPPNE